MTCDRCGAMVTENPSVALLTCEHCGNTFTTPEHDAVYREQLKRETEKEQLRIAEETRKQELELTREAQKMAHERETMRLRNERAQLRLGGFYGTLGAVRGMVVRTVMLVIGIGALAYAAPLVMQYGFLVTLGDPFALLETLGPFKSLYPYSAVTMQTFWFQMIVGVLLGVGSVLVRIGTVKRAGRR